MTTRPDVAASRGADRGVATVLAAGAVVVLLLVLSLLLELGAVVATRHRAEVAADLAALAGAAEGVRGREVGCARAASVAADGGGRLVACTWSGWTLSVRVEVACPCPLSDGDTLTGRARAGPS